MVQYNKGGTMDKLLKFKEVQDILRISRVTLLKILNSQELKGIKVGDQWRVSEQELKKYLGE